MPFNITELKQRMQGAQDVLEKEYVGLRTGRASTNMLETVTVDAYGSRMPLNQVGTVSVPEPRLLTVQVWDSGLTKSVEKAIRDAGLGLNPQGEGSLIRVPVPELSQERRIELQKVAGKYAEQRPCLRPQHPPRWHGCDQEDGKGQGNLRRRNETSERRCSETHRRLHQENRSDAAGQRIRRDENLG